LPAILWKYAQQKEIEEKELGKKQRQKTMALKSKQYDDLTAHVRQVRYRTVPHRCRTVKLRVLKKLLSNKTTE
jgi:hypothetical protein